jgi:hypothetical protein
LCQPGRRRRRDPFTAGNSIICANNKSVFRTAANLTPIASKSENGRGALCDFAAILDDPGFYKGTTMPRSQRPSKRKPDSAANDKTVAEESWMKLAEDLGRLIGEFLADEAAGRARERHTTSSIRKRKK